MKLEIKRFNEGKERKVARTKEGYGHALRLTTWYERILNQVKLFLKRKRYRGKEVSTAKAVEFLLDVFKGNEQSIKERYFKDEPEVLSLNDLTDEEESVEENHSHMAIRKVE